MTTKPKAGRGSEGWVVRRRDLLIALMVLIAVIVIVMLALYIGPDLLARIRRPALVDQQISQWCSLNKAEQNCAEWARQYRQQNPLVMQACGEATVDAMALEACIERFMSLKETVIGWCGFRRIKAGMAEDDLNCVEWSQDYIASAPPVLVGCLPHVGNSLTFVECLDQNTETFP